MVVSFYEKNLCFKMHKMRIEVVKNSDQYKIGRMRLNETFTLWDIELLFKFVIEEAKTMLPIQMEKVVQYLDTYEITILLTPDSVDDDWKYMLCLECLKRFNYKTEGYAMFYCSRKCFSDRHE